LLYNCIDIEQVFEELVMLSPKACAGELVMTPNTEAVLKTNR